MIHKATLQKINLTVGLLVFKELENFRKYETKHDNRKNVVCKLGRTSAKGYRKHNPIFRAQCSYLVL
jgi:hypothetical protein